MKYVKRRHKKFKYSENKYQKIEINENHETCT